MILYIKLWKDATIFANGFVDFSILGVEGAYHMHNAKDDSVEIYGGHIAFNKPGLNITQSQSARFVYLTEKTWKDTAYRFKSLLNLTLVNNTSRIDGTN